MARFTKDNSEKKHIHDILAELLKTGVVVKILLNNGNVIEGQITHESVGNNFNGKNATSFQNYAEMTVSDSKGNLQTIDYLDIKSVSKGKL